jgi:hypothetical protein
VTLPPRARQAIDKTLSNRIGDEYEHDRNGAGRRLQRPYSLRAICEDHVRRKRSQFRRVFASVDAGCGPADVNPDVATVGPAQRLQALRKHYDAGLRFRIVRGDCHEDADPTHPISLLRPRRERPRDRRAAEKRDELAAAAHSITSSAATSNLSGTARPSALAVLRLMTNSNLVGCITGKSAGFSPLRMRPV